MRRIITENERKGISEIERYIRLFKQSSSKKGLLYELDCIIKEVDRLKIEVEKKN